MADASTIVVSDELKQKFGPLIELILGSQSMNDEERQYWINTLSVMKPEQVQSLTEILTREKEQLIAIDKKYANVLSKAEEKRAVEEIGKERQEKQSQRKASEEEAEKTEQQTEEEILKKIQES